MTLKDLHVEEQDLGAGHLIVTRGDIDHATSPLVADALRRVTLEGEGHVILDMSDTRFIDSAGISTLLNGLRRLTRQRRKLVVVCPPGGPRRVFELLGLIGTFELSDTREQALAQV
jgi:anti-sigma B factor antagonist